MAAITDIAVGLLVADLLTQLALAQAAEIASGKYWQGLPTHQSPPMDGAVTAPDGVSRTPADQSKTWAAAGIVLPPTMPCACSVTIYDGPLGKGYELVTVYDEETGRHVRIFSVGPETWRTTNWMVSSR